MESGGQLHGNDEDVFADPEQMTHDLAELRLLVHGALCNPDILDFAEFPDKTLSEEQSRWRRSARALIDLSFLESAIQTECDQDQITVDDAVSLYEDETKLKQTDIHVLGLEHDISKNGTRRIKSLLTLMRNDHSLLLQKLAAFPRAGELACYAILALDKGVPECVTWIDSEVNANPEWYKVVQLLLGWAVEEDEPQIIQALMQKHLLERQDIGSVVRFAYYLRRSSRVAEWVRTSNYSISKVLRKERLGILPGRWGVLDNRKKRFSLRIKEVLDQLHSQFLLQCINSSGSQSTKLLQLRTDLLDVQNVRKIGSKTLHQILSSCSLIGTMRLTEVVSCVLLSNAQRQTKEEHELLTLAGDTRGGVFSDKEYTPLSFSKI